MAPQHGSCELKRKLTLSEVRDAIFVDFECRKGSAGRRPQPALLGVFSGYGDNFEQLILEPTLAPAARARPATLHVANAADAVRNLIASALQHSQSVVGWSYFDRDRMIDLCPDLADDIRRVYVNALHIARPWARTIYPGYPIEPADDFAPRHTLDQYAALARYPFAHKFKDAEPANWIAHVQAQLAATGGHYNKTTRQTKRDWHDLLDYNQHDLFALRQVVRQATEHMSAWHAYETTKFCVDDDRRRVCFLAGSQSGALDRLLERHAARTWAFITAWNPESKQLSPAENDARQAQLLRALEAAGLRYLRGEGVGADASWPPEQSLLVLGVSRGKAVSLGQQFGQLAIVWGRRGGPAQLISSARPPSVNGGRQQRPPARTQTKRHSTK